MTAPTHTGENRMPASILGRLAALPTAAISDALDELGFIGAVPDVEPLSRATAATAGFALTVKFVPKVDDPAAYRFGGGVGKPLEQVLKTMSEDQIVVMDLGGTTTASAWGGLASRLAQRKGVRGTLLYGTCRDVDEILELEYPVWCVGTYPRRSRNNFTFGAIGEPISLGEVRISPGDVIVGDATGVVCVPADLADRTVALCGEILADEESLLEQIASGSVVDWDNM